MSEVPQLRRRWPLLLTIAACVVVVGGVVLFRPRLAPAVAEEDAPEPSPPAAEIATGGSDILLIQPSTVHSMRLTALPARKISEEFSLRLTGHLMLDPNRLVQVHTRFSGEVVRVGQTASQPERPLRMGDRVEANQLLAVIWSKEIGEKKSDLVDALSQLKLHQTISKNLKSLQDSGAIPQRSIEEMQRNYESDLIQVERLQRTLRSWHIDEHELKECEDEALRIHEQASRPRSAGDDSHPADHRLEARWAEIDVRAPFAGVILEKNFTVGDIVTTDLTLFKIADLSRLLVMANVYEDDLPSLLGLPPERRNWDIFFLNTPGRQAVAGQIETIGSVIDPAQHTAAVWGHVDNSAGDLRVGQFAEAKIPLPIAPDWTEISARALVDKGADAFVLVALDHDLTKVQRRQVEVKRRTSQNVYVASTGPHGLRPDEYVLTRGVMELSAVLDELGAQDAAPVQVSQLGSSLSE